MRNSWVHYLFHPLTILGVTWCKWICWESIHRTLWTLGFEDGRLDAWELLYILPVCSSVQILGLTFSVSTTWVGLTWQPWTSLLQKPSSLTKLEISYTVLEPDVASKVSDLTHDAGYLFSAMSPVFVSGCVRLVHGSSGNKQFPDPGRVVYLDEKA